MNFILKLSLVLALSSNNLCALAFNHFNNLNNLSGLTKSPMNSEEARLAYKNLKRQSAVLSFLDCPFELIENQYNGIESVNIGTSYLLAYFTDLNKFQLQDLIFKCESVLRSYKEKARIQQIKSRAISAPEISAFLQDSSKYINLKERALRGLVAQIINQDTLCYNTHKSMELALVLGASLGSTSLECFTPLGRHFIWRGPSFGHGLGVMTAMTLPNSQAIPRAPSWSFKLYERAYQRKHFFEEHKTLSSSLLLGAATNIKNSHSPMKYNYDIKPMIGGGIMVEHEHNYLLKKRSFPLYFFLDKIIDINEVVANITSRLI